MSKRCGYAVTDNDGEQQPCDRPATGWRWYQDCEHEDTLEAACDRHANEGGRRMHDAEADVRLLNEVLEQMRPDPAGTKPSHPDPSSPEWGAWATLANEVTAALSRGGIWAILSRRTRVAGHLWEAGYRPTPERPADA